MGHHVQGFIGSRVALEAIQRRFGASRVVDLDRGWALLPLVAALFDAIPEEDESVGISDSRFEFLTPKIGKLLAEASDGGAIVYFETEYFGGTGDQRAIVAKNGEVVFGPDEGDDVINASLRLLGVRKRSAHDEFDQVGLSRFRSNESWISQPTNGRR